MLKTTLDAINLLSLLAVLHNLCAFVKQTNKKKKQFTDDDIKFAMFVMKLLKNIICKTKNQ